MIDQMAFLVGWVSILFLVSTVPLALLVWFYGVITNAS